MKQAKKKKVFSRISDLLHLPTLNSLSQEYLLFQPLPTLGCLSHQRAEIIREFSHQGDLITRKSAMRD